MSPDIEDLLDDDDQDEPKHEDKGNAAFAQIRKENRSMKKELEELRAYRVEQERVQRQNTVETVFAGLGLKPRHAKFYPADSDASPEAVKAWAVAEELLTVGEGEEEAPAPTQTTGFTPTVIGEGVIPASKVYTREEFEQIMRENPSRGQALAEAGRVKWHNL